MREIKYRAWNTVSEQFFIPSKIDFLRKHIYINDDEYYAWDSVILEQFTGIYDKNGKEIYSGDIVEIVYGKKKWKYVIATEWDGYYGIFELLFYVNFKEKFNDVIFGDFYFKVGEMYNHFVFVTGKLYEVIGNIHENKDLLDEKVL